MVAVVDCVTVEGFLIPIMPRGEADIFFVVRKVFSLLDSDDWRRAGICRNCCCSW